MTTTIDRREFLHGTGAVIATGVAGAAGVTAIGAAAAALFDVQRRTGRTVVGAAAGEQSGGAPLLVKRAHACGTTVTLLIDASDPVAARTAAQRALAEIFGVHQLMTRFEPSPLSRVNERGWREPVAVPASLFGLLERSIQLNRQTAGLFDVTLGNVVDAISGRRSLGDSTARTQQRAPGAGGDRQLATGTASERQLAQLREAIGAQRLQLEPGARSVRLAHPLTALDLGGIAKGHAIDTAAAAMRGAGVENFLINAGGEIYAAGHGPDDARGWRIELPAPARRAGLDAVWLRDQAIATSGNYLQAAQRSEPRFVHLIDPRHGSPAQTLTCASAIASSATVADVWSTAAFVGGRDVPSLVQRGNGVTLFLVDGAGRADELRV